MGDRVLYYSVLRYKPYRLSGEVINLGILFSEPSVGFAKFYSISRFSRLSSFDDEINIKNVQDMLKSIKREVDLILKTQGFDIEKYIEFYIGKIAFDSPKLIHYENMEDRIEQIRKVYLRFDFEKKDRSLKEDDKNLFKDMLLARNIRVSKNVSHEGEFNDVVRYDLETESSYIKFFDFDKKDLSRSIASAKTWAWNGMHSEKKLIILYRYDEEKMHEPKEMNTIKKIFSSANIDSYNVDNMDSALNEIVGQ